MLRAKIKKEPNRSIFLIIVKELPEGFERNNKSLEYLEYLCKIFHKKKITDPEIDQGIVDFFYQVYLKLDKEIKRTNWKPRGKPGIARFVYEENFTEKDFENFDNLLN